MALPGTRRAFRAEPFPMTRIPNIARGPTSRAGSIPPPAFRRPRWDNLLLAASLALFWAGVILKILG